RRVGEVPHGGYRSARGEAPSLVKSSPVLLLTMRQTGDVLFGVDGVESVTVTPHFSEASAGLPGHGRVGCYPYGYVLFVCRCHCVTLVIAIKPPPAPTCYPLFGLAVSRKVFLHRTGEAPER